MTRYMFIIMLSLGLAGVACSKKVKPEDDGVTQVGETTGDTSITSDPLSFDASGSDSGRIDGLSTIFFGYDQAQLTGDARRTLQTNADWIRARKDVVIQIEGHCDSRGSTEYNLALGERRAKAVRAYLVSLGVDANRLTVMSYGEEKPLDMGDSEEAYSRNRRANFVPIKK